jgi:hypothetical protein
VVAAAVALVIVGVTTSSNSANTGSAGNQVAATTPASSAPVDTYVPPATTSPVDTYVPPAPVSTAPVSTAPVSDPNNVSTDLTPLTASALLPQTFTDSNGDTFTLQAGGPRQTCLSSDQTSTAQHILSQYGCTEEVTGSYTNENDVMLVSVNVFPLSSSSTAQQAYSAMEQAKDDGDLHAGDFGVWCPTSGTGAVCNNNGFSAATKEGSFDSDDRYVIVADALWINLSQDTSSTYEGDLSASATAAVTSAGPRNWSGS